MLSRNGLGQTVKQPAGHLWSIRFCRGKEVKQMLNIAIVDRFSSMQRGHKNSSATRSEMCQRQRCIGLSIIHNDSLPVVSALSTVTEAGAESIRSGGGMRA